MAKTRQQKEAILEQLREGLGNAASAVFVHFTGLPVADEQKARQTLKDEGVSYFVARKTLIKKALGETSVAGELPALDGEIAVAYTGADGDPTAPARNVYALGKQLGAERFSIVGGIFEQKYLSSSEMTEIATIPSVPVLRGMFVNAINSPIQGLVLALNAYAEKKETA